MCRNFWTTRRQAIAAAIVSLLLFTGLTAMACTFSVMAAADYKAVREELGNSTVTRRNERLEIFDRAKDEQLSYLFWTWMVILSALTICIDAIFFLPAAFFFSKTFARLYLVTISMMFVLNLTPLMFLLDIDSRGKSVGRFSALWYGWIAALIYTHNILNWAVVWFLLEEIDQNPNQNPEFPSTTATSTSTRTSHGHGQFNPLTPPIEGSLMEVYSMAMGSFHRERHHHHHSGQVQAAEPNSTTTSSISDLDQSKNANGLLGTAIIS